jgi:4-hydroxy-tetrahydrodipicolinate reductase
MASLRIALYGTGRMGTAIADTAQQRGHAVVLRVSSTNAGTPPAGVDVAIEFSRPEEALNNMRLCLAAGVPVVVGTTGWYDHLPRVQAMVAEHHGTLLWASNFSIGVNLLFQVNRMLAGLMDRQPQYRADLLEVHHVHKRDAPSGTALTMARDIDLVHHGYEGWQLDGDPNGQRPSPLPIRAVREDEVPGTHEVTWTSAEDRISLRHEAFGRTGFATGAVVAAEWIQGRKGLFTMRDVLDIQ